MIGCVGEKKNFKGGLMKHFFVAIFLVLCFGLSLLADAQNQKGVVNINTASEKELKLLPRIGDVVAKRIVEFRQKNGKFQKLEDLMLVKGIGKKLFEALKPYIALSGETTLKEKIKLSRGSK